MKNPLHLLLLLLFIFTIILVSIIADDIQAIFVQGIKFDTIGHMVGFFALAWFLNAVLKLPLLNLSFTLIVYAALTELGQLYLGFRNGEMSDFIADIVGIMLFVAIKWCSIVYGKQNQ